MAAAAPPPDDRWSRGRCARVDSAIVRHEFLASAPRDCLQTNAGLAQPHRGSVNSRFRHTAVCLGAPRNVDPGHGEGVEDRPHDVWAWLGACSVELGGLEPLTSPCHGGQGNAGDGPRALTECRDVQALPPQFGPGAPQFCPSRSNATARRRHLPATSPSSAPRHPPMDSQTLTTQRLARIQWNCTPKAASPYLVTG